MKDEERYELVTAKYELFAREYFDGGDELNVCRECGCLVISKPIHNAWHKGVGVHVIQKD